MIDLSFAKAAVVLPKEYRTIRFFQVGVGGTGSFTAMNLARLAFELQRLGKSVGLTLIDPDRVETGNIPRSNFCAAEVGRFKAQTMAERISAAWGLEVAYANERFCTKDHLGPRLNYFQELTILVGCVDNHHARREIDLCLMNHVRHHSSPAPNVWWIDGGNGRNSGQVVLGSEADAPESYFAADGICRKLPLPSVVHPELLKPDLNPAETRFDTQNLTCAERILIGEQSLNINQRVAVEISQMLSEFLLTRTLRRFAVYFDLESGSSRSLYCTPEQINVAIPPKFIENSIPQQ